MEKEEKIYNNEIIESIIEKENSSWQYLIYDLIKNNQIDPWDIDIIKLTNKFLEKVEEFDKKNLHISSKVLLIAAILIKFKVEYIYNQLKKKEEKSKEKENFVFNDEIPKLYPKIPLLRERKITLEELMNALKNAIRTEERRIKRKVYSERGRLNLSTILPKKRINWIEKINEIYKKILNHIKREKYEEMYFSQLLKKGDREEKIMVFVPLLHLDFQKKIYLEQEKFLDDIKIKLYAGVPEPGQTGRT